MKKIVALASLLLSAPAWSGQVVLSWVLPTQCSDGSTLTFCPLTGLNVERASTATGPWTSVETLAPTLTTKTYTNIAPGPTFWRLLSASGSIVSAPSNVASKVVDPSIPNPPSAVAAN